ncbi:sugar ABC transporter ATP-binding protein [Mollicutes bacterium LVI A0039]|nr:sugar ABC transporter ATP-binding protein [Mollicutes bacterium LVI A0039]
MKKFLEIKNVTKRFGDFKAIDSITMDVSQNEIHAICGENGAGKSTLMKTLSGVYPSGTYEGEFHFEGKLCQFKDIKDSEKSGIVIIHQELTLIPELSIMENIFLGNEMQSGNVVNWSEQKKSALQLMKLVGLTEKPETLVVDLGIGQQQLIEIAKALSKNSKILILDEPTAALNEIESQKLLDLLKKLRNNGLTAMIISHKLNEIIEVCDRVTIIRDGKKIETLDVSAELDQGRIIKGMVGRSMDDIYPQKTHSISTDNILEVKDLTVLNPETGRPRLEKVNFHLKKGEVVGIGGLMGAGRTELALTIFGNMYGKVVSGEILVNGKKIDFSTVKKAMSEGIAYVSEDRKKYGLVLDDTLAKNMSLATLDEISTRHVIDKNQEQQQALDYKEQLNMRITSINQLASSLSGGNQQKIVLAKWLLANPEILILDEPTRGIDVGAKQEIYQIINELSKQGKSIILISSEMPELIGISDRVYVMNEGRIIKELSENINAEIIMEAIVKDKKGDL